MRATGIVRRMDDLGRVVIPKEIRTSMRIKVGDPLEIFTDKGTVCFRKYSPIGQLDLDLIKRVCDKGLGKLNYTVYDADGESFLPNGVEGIDIEKALGENIVPINCDGDCIGFIQSPSGNREMVAEIVGGMLED